MTSYGTGTTTVTGPGFTVISGLFQSITVPSNSVLYVSTDGGVQTSSAATAGLSIVDVALYVNATARPNAGWRRLYINNTQTTVNQVRNWSFSDSVVVPAGTYTIDVRAALIGGSAAFVSGDSTSVNQGQLTVIILKQ